MITFEVYDKNKGAWVSLPFNGFETVAPLTFTFMCKGEDGRFIIPVHMLRKELDARVPFAGGNMLDVRVEITETRVLKECFEYQATVLADNATIW